MVVCSYYLRGACKYGDRCRNEHPVPAGTFGNQTWTSNNNRVVVPYTIESMKGDITPNKDKPLWPLSSYGPAKHEPVIISGLDESPEELHLKAVIALGAGTTDEYIKYEGEKTATADQVYTNARNNVRLLYEQALKISGQSQASGAVASSSVPAFPTQIQSVFGTNPTSAPGRPVSVFGGQSATSSSVPSFTAPAPSAFGMGLMTSPFGQPSQTTSAFGPTNQATSVFHQPTQPSSVFGQPSAFGVVSSPMTITPPSEMCVSNVPDFSGAKLTARMRPGADRYLSLLPHDYNEMIPADVKAAFTSAKFEWGKIPDWIPPAEVR